MRIPFSRTYKKYLYKTKELLYDALKMDCVPEERQRIARVKSMGFDGQWEQHRTFQMAFLHRNGITESTRFLEIGSGPLTLGTPLMQELNPGNYTGVDVRESVTNLAYLEISREGLSARNPKLIVSNDFGATALGDATFDIIWSFSVLYHLSDELVEEWFTNVKKRLAPDGRYWANFNDGMEESQWLEFPFNKRNADFYEAVAAKQKMTLKTLGTLADLGFKSAGADSKNIMIEIKHA